MTKLTAERALIYIENQTDLGACLMIAEFWQTMYEEFGFIFGKDESTQRDFMDLGFNGIKQ